MLEFIERHAGLGVTSGAIALDIETLTHKGLRALQAYYPAPPEEPGLAFDFYSRTLKDALSDPRYTGHALTRLTVIGMWKLSDLETRDSIKKFPQSLANLVAHWLGSGNQVASERALSIICGHCLSLDSSRIGDTFVSQLEESLARNRATLQLNKDLDLAVNHLDRQIRIDTAYFDQDALDMYRTKFLEPLLQDGSKVGKSLAKMIDTNLIKAESDLVRRSIAHFKELALRPVLQFTLAESQHGAQTDTLLTVWGHCLALDGKAPGFKIYIHFQIYTHRDRWRSILGP